MPAAAEAVIVIERNTKAPIRSIGLEKVRDGVEGPLGEFTLKTVVLDKDQDGDAISTCTVEPSHGVTARGPRRPEPESQAGKALNELEHLLIAGKGEASHGHTRIPDGVMRIKRADWQAACRKKRLITGWRPHLGAARQSDHRTLIAILLPAQ